MSESESSVVYRPGDLVRVIHSAVAHDYPHATVGTLWRVTAIVRGMIRAVPEGSFVPGDGCPDEFVDFYDDEVVPHITLPMTQYPDV